MTGMMRHLSVRGPMEHEHGLQLADVHEGSRLKCVDNSGAVCMVEGGIYAVHADPEGCLYVECDGERPHFLDGWLHRFEKEGD